MSGVEIAGLVLGAIPLVVVALQHYEACEDKVKIFCYWRKHLDKTCRTLLLLHSSYKMTIETVLQPITNAAELEEMLAQPGSLLWHSPSIRDSLQSSLRYAYASFVHLTFEINSVIEELLNHLDLDRHAGSANVLEAALRANRPTSAANGPNFGYTFTRRLGFTMKSGRVKQLLGRLERYIAHLDTFCSKAKELDASITGAGGSRNWHAVRSTAKKLQRYQKHAEALHGVLARGLRCPMHSLHRAYLLLEWRVADTSACRRYCRRSGGDDNDDADTTRFTVSVADPEAPHRWRRAEVRVQIDHELPERSAGNITFCLSPASPAVPPHIPLAPGPLHGATSAASLAEVDDLCAALNRLHSSAPCVGFYLDSTGRLRGGYPMTAPPYPEAISTVTLAELISDSSNAFAQPKLSLVDRLALAVVLTSSMLQLHSTPWLRRRLSADDIVFLRTQQSGADWKVHFEHPYISQLYCAANPATERSHFSANLDAAGYAADDTALVEALSIMLLEIYFGQPIHSVRTPSADPCSALSGFSGSSSRNKSDNGGGRLGHVSAGGGGVAGHGESGSSVTDYTAIAFEWARRERKNMSAAFGGAVKHCISCQLQPRTNWSDESFQYSMVDQVLLPMMRELQGCLEQSI